MSASATVSNRASTRSLVPEISPRSEPRDDLPVSKLVEFPDPVKSTKEEVGETITNVENRDGGWQGWATVIGAWIIQFIGFGYTNAFGVYQDYYVREYLSEYSTSDVSWIGSIQVFLMMAMGLLSGRLFDQGYFYHMIIGGSIITVFSLFMLSLTKPHEYYQVFLSHGIGVGLGSGLIYIPSMAVIAHHFRHRRAMAMGIVASGSSMGGVVHPIMLNNLFYGSVGFANGVRASAGMILGLVVVAIALMRTTLPPSPPANWAFAAKKFSRDSAYVFAVIGISLIIMSLFFPIFYLQLDATEHGLNATFSFYSLSIQNTASVIGRIVPGFFAHSVGVQNMITVCSAACGIMIFSMLPVKTVLGVSFFAVFFGFFSGSFITMASPILALLSDDVSEVGARMGFCFAFAGVGALIGTPITGALLTQEYVWWRGVLFNGVACFAGAGSLIISRIIIARRQRVAKS